jgi:ATP-dependent RNA helicase RhlE
VPPADASRADASRRRTTLIPEVEVPFTKLGLPAPLLKGVRAAGYTEPTPIQARAIPLILAGHDLIGAAQTGTGKTAAFLLPMIAHMMDGRTGLRGLVLVPTRELAAQVETNARDYARFTEVRASVVYGGVPIGPQMAQFRRGEVDLLVATPGRLLDLHGRMALRLDQVEMLVLDEADRMVDMGFAPDLRRILALLPRKRQTMMFSATMPPDLNRVANEALIKPQRVDLAPPSRPAAGITQAVYPVPKHLKPELLDQVLLGQDVTSVLVFVRTKHGADRLARQLQKRGHSVAALHGDRTQGQRERALSDLKRGRVSVMVATDIASRGIDVVDISHVINYDVPRTPEDYVHRIGRTGRVDATGDAFTLMSPEEEPDVRAIERFLGRSIPRVIIPDFDYKRRALERSAGGAERGDGGRGGARRGGEARRSGRAQGEAGPPRTRRARAEASATAAPARRGDAPLAPQAGAGGDDDLSHGRRRRLNEPGRRRRRI